MKQREKDVQGAEGAAQKLWDSRKKEILAAVDKLFAMVLGRESR
jgi:hypothetical protein